MNVWNFADFKTGQGTKRAAAITTKLAITAFIGVVPILLDQLGTPRSTR